MLCQYVRLPQQLIARMWCIDHFQFPIDDIFATETIELDGPFRAVLQYPRQCRRLNRTIKETTVKRYHYDSHAQLTAHLHDFVNAYNYGRRLKTLRGLTP